MAYDENIKKSIYKWRKNNKDKYNDVYRVANRKSKQNNKAYNKTPRAHISAGGPEYSILLTISGAMYEGVPQNILTFFSWGIHVENPKSISFTLVLVSSNNIFSSFISLCVTFL